MNSKYAEFNFVYIILCNRSSKCQTLIFILGRFSPINMYGRYVENNVYLLLFKILIIIRFLIYMRNILLERMKVNETF